MRAIPHQADRNRRILSAQHHHGHDHGHAHGSRGHGHVHVPKDFGRAFGIGVALNAGFVVLEAGAGWLTGSLALLADAGHNLSDVAGLLLAWAAAAMTRRAPTARRTYGLGRSTILASLGNAMLLLFAVGAIVWEALHRFGAPQPIDSWTVAGVAGAGIAVNAATAMLFFRGAKDDLNIRGAYLHMVADAAVSLGVVLAALAIAASGWLWLDPAMSIVIAAVIAWGTWGLLTESTQLAMDGVPRSVDHAAVETWLTALPGVAGVHDLHIWALSTAETALTAHVVRPGAGTDDAFLSATATGLRSRFGIGHSTLQIEHDAACAPCSLHRADHRHG